MYATLVPTGFISAFNGVNDSLHHIISWSYDHSMAWIMLVALLAGGIYFTVITKGVQFRYFHRMISTVMGSRKGAGEEGISSFQAFTMGLADRVGTGNIAGVAIALALGGPGAIFWMWVVASIGMATALLESTLAQVFKIRNADGSFRGGPAYYMSHGLGLKWVARIFAVCLILTKGCAFVMVQANTVASTAEAIYHVPTWTSAVILFVLSAPFIIAGVKPVARLLEYIAPLMAVLYLALAVFMLVVNFERIPTVIGWIFQYAFGVHSVTGGIAGGIITALLQGTRRGLYSNEAGEGTVPNAAATATVNHPVKQGLIQSLGVFADTMVVCTATAFIIMVSGVYDPTAHVDSPDGAAMTLNAVGTLGEWTTPLMIVIITIFSYSTILGNYAYAEANVKFLRGMGTKANELKVLLLASMVIGAVMKLEVVWAFADWMAAICAVINIYAVLRLLPWGIGTIKDYAAQLKLGTHPDEIEFCTTNNPFLPDDLIGSVWTADAWSKRLAERPDRPRRREGEDLLSWLMRESRENNM